MADKKLTKAQQAKKLDNEKGFDPSVSQHDLISDLKRLQSENPLSEISRDFYRLNGEHSERTWIKHFGMWTAFKSAAGLAPNKMQRKVNASIAHQVHLDIYRTFMIEEVLPCTEKYLKSPKDPNYPEIAVISDIHDLQIDMFTFLAFLRMCELRQPDNIVLNGDIFDNYEASTKYPIDNRLWFPKKRFLFVQYLLRLLREVCPNAQIDLVAGNHELRALHRLAALDPFTRAWLSDCLGINLAQWFGLEQSQVNLVCKFDLAAFSNKEVKEAVEENFQVYYDCWVAHHTHDDGFGMAGSSGHIHRPGMTSDHNVPMGTFDWMVTGCVKKKRAEYINGKNKWTNGFGYVYIDAINKTVQQQPFNIHGDFVVIDGHRLTRTEMDYDVDDLVKMLGISDD
jgi:predicted phosphodiesterase